MELLRKMCSCPRQRWAAWIRSIAEWEIPRPLLFGLRCVVGIAAVPLLALSMGLVITLSSALALSVSIAGLVTAVLLGVLRAALWNDGTAFVHLVRIHWASNSSNWKGFWVPAVLACAERIKLISRWIDVGSIPLGAEFSKDIEVPTGADSLGAIVRDIPSQLLHLWSYRRPFIPVEWEER